MGENAKIINGCKKFNISTITHLIQTIISALEILNPLDAFQIFEHQYPTSIDEHTTSIGSINGHFNISSCLLLQLYNSATTCLFQPKVSALEI
jgi:hypothetical protein